MTYAECRPGRGQPDDGDDQSKAGEGSSEGNRVTRLPVRSLVLRSVSAVRARMGVGRAGTQPPEQAGQHHPWHAGAGGNNRTGRPDGR
jgi:hypothetical protein